MAKGITKAAPKSSEILFENDRVRVIELNVNKGSKAEMHTHPAFMVYAITRFDYNAKNPQGKTKRKRMKAGEVEWSDGESHEVVFGNKARALLVEFK